MIVYADAVAALVALSLFLLFFYGPWQAVMVDVARQVAFEERDAVFDLAAEGSLDFESPDYKTIRNSFNQLIRFAHELNWMRLLMYGRGPKEVSDVHLAIDRIEDVETRQKVARHLQKARYAMMGMIGGKSLLLLIALVFVAIITWCMGTTRELLAKMDGRFGEKMQREAEGA
jgi:hypothetical protein